MMNKTLTKGNVIVEEIRVGDIHYEYEYGVCRRTIVKLCQKSRNVTMIIIGLGLLLQIVEKRFSIQLVINILIMDQISTIMKPTLVQDSFNLEIHIIGISDNGTGQKKSLSEIADNMLDENIIPITFIQDKNHQMLVAANKHLPPNVKEVFAIAIAIRYKENFEV